MPLLSPEADAAHTSAWTEPGGRRPLQDFPVGEPASLRAEHTRLDELVHHREAVPADTTLEQCYLAFRERQVDYLAVVGPDGVIGLSSRGQIGFIMGSRFGFAIYSQNAVTSALVPAPLIFSPSTSIREVLDRTLARAGEAFHQDVIVVDSRNKLVGLIKAETLAHLQSRLVTEQLEALREQHEVVRRQHLELFRAGHAVRQSQGLYLGLFAAHSLGVALLDPAGAVHEHNRRLGELIGFEGDATSIISLADLVDEKERPAFLALLRTQAQGDTAPATAEFTLHLPVRGPRIFRCSTGWIRETGQICACLDDVTEQRLFERNALQHEKQVMLDTLVGGIAHELNNKLTPVQGFAELLLLDLRGPARSYAQCIQKSVEEAAHIIRQLLQLSKPSQPPDQTVDLRGVIEETLVMLRFQIRETETRIVRDLPAQPVPVLGDPGQLKQVVLNILLNALQAAESAEWPEVTLALTAPDGNAELVIGDNGCGIPPDILPRVFDPFFTTKGAERGTGLGLSVCFGIVRRHGGEIQAASPPGSGARFRVRLPLDRFGMPVVSDRTDLAPRPATLGLARGRRILVVDDDDIVALLLQEIIVSNFGAEVDVAPDGIRALELIEQREYALIISDIQMPEMSGPELYARLFTAHPVAAARFIFVTGYSGSSELEQRITAWKVPVIAKPFRLPRLIEVCVPILRAGGSATQFQV